MSAGHTPGPWSVDPSYPGDIITADKRDIASAFNQKHAGVSLTIADSVFASLDEQAANARLIAAAPDLLAACEAFVAYDAGDEADGVGLMLAYNTAITAARTAIAKATQP